MLYAIEGLCHMGTDFGSILLLSTNQGEWSAKDYLKLPYAPMAIGLDSDKNFIIVTSSALLSVDVKTNITVLEEYAKWQPSKYHSSLVIKNDIVYIGMKEGIYKLNLKTKKAEWLLPN